MGYYGSCLRPLPPPFVRRLAVYQRLSFLVFFRHMDMSNTPNWQHHSRKEQKRKLKPAALRARKAALKALKRKLAA